eukprot:13733205-Alexandrium_andersonii.AAC.1
MKTCFEGRAEREKQNNAKELEDLKSKERPKGRRSQVGATTWPPDPLANVLVGPLERLQSALGTTRAGPLVDRFEVGANSSAQQLAYNNGTT